MQALMIKQAETKSRPEDYLNVTNNGAGDAPSTMYTPLISSLSNGPTHITPYHYEDLRSENTRTHVDAGIASGRLSTGSTTGIVKQLLSSCISVPYVGTHNYYGMAYSPIVSFLDCCASIQDAGVTDLAFFSEAGTKPNIYDLKKDLNGMPVANEVLMAIEKIDGSVMSTITDMLDNPKKDDRVIAKLNSPLNPQGMEYTRPGFYSTSYNGTANNGVSSEITNGTMEQGTENASEIMTVFVRDLFRVVKCYIDTYRGANNW